MLVLKVYKRSFNHNLIPKKKDLQVPKLVQRMSSLEEPMAFDCLPTTPRRRRRSFTFSSNFDKSSLINNGVGESWEKRLDGRFSWQSADLCTQNSHSKREDNITYIAERDSGGSCGGLDDGYAIYSPHLCLLFSYEYILMVHREENFWV